MTDKEILEGNALIAQFMGLSQEPDGWKEVLETSKEGENLYVIHEELFFDCSWDSLVPVIEKINKLETKLYSDQNNERKAEYADYYNNILNALTSFKIEDTWSQVVSFVKWYNSKSETIRCA